MASEGLLSAAFDGRVSGAGSATFCLQQGAQLEYKCQVRTAFFSTRLEACA
jgi:hypothetical protein